jgi:hypothetical protein
MRANAFRFNNKDLGYYRCPLRANPGTKLFVPAGQTIDIVYTR